MSTPYSIHNFFAGKTYSAKPEWLQGWQMFADTSSGLHQWGITLHFLSMNQYLVQQLNSMNGQLQPVYIVQKVLDHIYRKE